MNEQSVNPQRAESQQDLARYLFDRHGALLPREALSRELGFPTPDALDRYMQRGHLGLRLIRLPHRRGYFATPSDLADYITRYADDSLMNREERERSR